MKNILIYSMVMLGVLLRLYKFGQIPTSLNRDEAALGYNAYAIWQEGIDEWGNSYPIVFKSFGDYKLPGYIYLLTIAMRMGGLPDSIIRLPSLLAGLSLIPLSYLLARGLAFKKTSAVCMAGLVAISPWAVFYSRVAFEANVALAFFILACVMFLQTPTFKTVSVGMGSYFLAIATYNTPLLVFPLVILIIWSNRTANSKQKTIVSVLMASIAMGWFFAIKPLMSQKSNITIFSDPTTDAVRVKNYTQSQTFWQKMRFNRYVYYTTLIAKNSYNSISMNFLTWHGGSNPWHSLPGKGHFYIVEYVLFIVGVLVLLKKSLTKSLVLFSIVFIGLLPAVVTVDAPHATRSLIAFIGILLIAASVYRFTKVRLLITIALLCETVFFAKAYFQDFPSHHSPEWLSGLKEKIVAVQSIFSPNQPIALIKPQDQSYIYTLLYTKTSPTAYQKSVNYYGKDASGLELVKSYQRWLFVGDIKDVPPNTPIVYQDEQGSYHLINNNLEKKEIE